MRSIKKIFGRLFIVGSAIILQILLFFVMLSWSSNFIAESQFIMFSTAFVVLITVINRDMTAEAKIPWVILVLISPLFGSIAYIFFGENHISRKHRKLLLEINKISRPYLTLHPEVIKEIEEISPKYCNQINHLKRASGQIPYKNTETKFYPIGEEYYADLLRELESATKYIFLEFFILKFGNMLDTTLRILKQKAAAGVEVRLMYDDIGSIGQVPEHFDKELRKYGIKCIKFSPFIPVISEHHNNRDHRKIVVVDGRTAFTGGINIADEYINEIHPFGHWKDSGIRIRGDAVEGFTLMFLQSYDLQSGEIDNFDNYINKNSSAIFDSNGYVIPYADGPRPQYNEYIAENIFLNMIGAAEKYIYITTPYLIIDNILRTALCNAAERGVDVRIVTPHIPDKKTVFTITRSYYKKLQESGVSIYEYTDGFIHAKQFVCDGEFAHVGTVNLDYRSLVHHYECGVLLYKTNSIADILKDFDSLFKTSINMKNFRLHGFAFLLSKLAAVFTPLL